MKRLLPLIATLFAIACCAAQNLRKVPLADPFILLYDGVYYAYGTGAGSGIEVWTSRDLSTWERAKGNARDWPCTARMSGAKNGSGRPRSTG